MLASALILASAVIVLVLGTIHLVYTFASTKFLPRDASLVQRMQGTAPRITRSTTMWNMWIGFHASHSLGAMLFGAVYSCLAAAQPEFFFRMKLVVLIGALFLAAMLVIAMKYWFRIPLAGIALSLALYLAGCVAAYA